MRASSLLQPTRARGILSRSRSALVPRAQAVSQMTTTKTEYDVVVKANLQDPSKLGDCPFCHRVLLFLETKQVPYKKTLIDVNNKPQWLQEQAEGKVPVLKNEPAGLVLPDSDKIVELLEKEHPTPAMLKDADLKIGSSMFPAFREYVLLKEGAPEREVAAKRAAFLAQLWQIEAELLKQGRGPLFGGSQLNGTDAALAPKLYHAQVALKHFQGFEFPSELRAVRQYLDTIKSTDQWKATDYGADAIIAGWKRHREM